MAFTTYVVLKRDSFLETVNISQLLVMEKRKEKLEMNSNPQVTEKREGNAYNYIAEGCYLWLSSDLQWGE